MSETQIVTQNGTFRKNRKQKIKYKMIEIAETDAPSVRKMKEARIKICNRYIELKQKYPEATEHSLLCLIAKRSNTHKSYQAVRKVLISAGIYKYVELCN